MGINAKALEFRSSHLLRTAELFAACSSDGLVCGCCMERGPSGGVNNWARLVREGS